MTFCSAPRLATEVASLMKKVTLALRSHIRGKWHLFDDTEESPVDKKYKKQRDLKSKGDGKWRYYLK